MTIVIGADKRHLKTLFASDTQKVSTNLEAFAKVPTVSLMRPDCETHENFVHYITYVVLRDIETGDIFRYRRGTKGGETRLHGDYSIGVGGHVEKSGGVVHSTVEMVLRTIRQELLEEVQVTVDPAIASAIAKQLTGEESGAYLIYDNSNEVGRVHLGVAVVLPVNKSEIGSLEEGVLLEPEWVATKQAISDHLDGSHKLENWSQFMVFTVDTNQYADYMSRLKIEKVAA